MTHPNNNRAERAARLKWVPIALMKVSPVAQREFRPHRAEHLAAAFDLEQLGTPVVSERDGWFYLMDGQHRIAALRLIGWEDQQIQCWVYDGLTETEEAERFLTLNDALPVDAYSRFKVAVVARRATESDIDRIVHDCGLVVSNAKEENSVAAVGTLVKAYNRDGAEVLARSLGILRDAYGGAGLIAATIDGISLLCSRYNGALDTEKAVKQLAGKRGGLTALLQQAEVTRRATGQQRGPCVASTAVEFINAGRGGTKLPSWWKEA